MWLKNNCIWVSTEKKLKTLMKASIQPEKSRVVGNKREANILKLYIKLHEPMKRLFIMNTSFAFVKIHMEIALAKIRFADKG